MAGKTGVKGITSASRVGPDYHQQSVHDFLEKEARFVVHAFLVDELSQELHGGDRPPFFLGGDVHVLHVQDKFLSDRRNQHVHSLTTLDLKFQLDLLLNRLRLCFVCELYLVDYRVLNFRNRTLYNY